MPITTRLLEALIRLCQARAKACLRDFVLEEDAHDVIELMSKSMEQIHSQASCPFTSSASKASSKRGIRRLFISELQTSIGVGSDCEMDDLRRIAKRVNCELSAFPELIEELRLQGLLMKLPNGTWKVLS